MCKCCLHAERFLSKDARSGCFCKCPISNRLSKTSCTPLLDKTALFWCLEMFGWKAEVEINATCGLLQWYREAELCCKWERWRKEGWKPTLREVLFKRNLSVLDGRDCGLREVNSHWEIFLYLFSLHKVGGSGVTFRYRGAWVYWDCSLLLKDTEARSVTPDKRKWREAAYYSSVLLQLTPTVKINTRQPDKLKIMQSFRL